MGRGVKCDMKYEKTFISKVQCTFRFEDDNWVLYDGLSLKNGEHKESMNGLWLLANPPVVLKDNDLLSTGAYKISVKINEEV